VPARGTTAMRFWFSALLRGHGDDGLCLQRGAKVAARGGKYSSACHLIYTSELCGGRKGRFSGSLFIISVFLAPEP
jgi:hypothetical protein